MGLLAEFVGVVRTGRPGVRRPRTRTSTTSRQSERAASPPNLPGPSDGSGKLRDIDGAVRADPGRCSARWRHGRRPWTRRTWSTSGRCARSALDLAARAAAERRAPGSTTLAQDIEVLLDAAASLGNEYARSASLGHILELYVDAGLYEQARSPRRAG